MAEESVNAMLEVAQTNPYFWVPPLQLFSAHPYFWKPSEITDIWCNTGKHYYQNIKEAKDRVSPLFEVQPELRELDIQAIQHQILGHENNWENALHNYQRSIPRRSPDIGPERSLYFYMTASFNRENAKILEQVLGLRNIIREEHQNRRPLTPVEFQAAKEQKLENHNRRISNLLICIRHKFEHATDLPLDGQAALFNSSVGNSQAFVQIFINALPKLVPFVGINKGNFSESFAQHKCSFPFDLKEFLVQLKSALDCNIMKGGLEKRYQDNPVTCNLTLEFRKPDKSLEIPVGTTALAAIIGDDRMKIIWNGIEDELAYAFSGDTLLENTCIIFSNTECKVDQLLERCAENRIIIVDRTITNVSDIVNVLREKYNCNLVEVEVNWEDICQCKAENYAFARNVYFNKLKVPIKQILSEEEVENFVRELKGDELNKLLRNEAFQIFDKYERPSLLDFYIDREFLEKVVIESDTLTRDMQIVNDIFIICGIKYDEAKNWFPKNQEPLIIEMGKTDHFRVWGSNVLRYRIVLIEDSMEWSADIFEIIGEKNWFKTYNIHCFKYMKQNALTWIGSKGNDSVLNEMSDKCLNTNQPKLSEDRLVDAISENIRAIILSGVPGSGKSEAMNKLANDMFDKRRNSIVAVIEIDQFVAKLRKIRANTNNELHTSTVVNTLTELGCSSNFKKQVAKRVLLSSQANAKAEVKIELMFDGFDEATSVRERDFRELLIESVKYIIEHMPSVRIWISIRDHLVHELENPSQTVHVTMIPFSRNEQIDFVFKQMEQYIKENSTSESQVVTDAELKALAKDFTTIDIARTPLHCYLISQFYAEKALQNDFSIEENSPTLYQLYKNLFCQKFFIYHRKIGVNLQKSHLKLAIYREPFDRMMHRHIYCALVLLYSDDCANWFQQEMYLNIESKNSKKLASLVVPYGLIQGLEPIRFLHLTFAEYLVALFIRQLITKQLENRISTEETTFLEFAKWNTLRIDKIPGKEYPDFKNPNIAYFLYAGLASYVAQTSSSFDEKEKNGTQHSKAMGDCKKMNDEIVEFIFSIIPEYKIPDLYIKEKETFKKLSDVRVAPCFPSQNLFMLLYQKRQLEFCKHIILLGKRSNREVVPLVLYQNKIEEIEIIEASFTSNKLSLFEVRPNPNTVEFVKRKLLSTNDNWLKKLKEHFNKLLSKGNLEDKSLLDWVKFLFDELKNTAKERKQANKNADADDHGRWSEDPCLCCAVENKTSNSSSIEYLCKLGLDVNMPDSIDRTPLMVAAENGRIDLVEPLLSQGADMTLQDSLRGNSVFYYAAKSGSVVLMEILMQKNSKLFNDSGVSILRGALESRSVPLAEFVLPKFQHLISEINTSFLRIIDFFALGDKSKFIQECAKKNLNVNVCKEDGETLLHFILACPDGKDDAIALLNAGADMYAVNKNEECPIYTCLINSSLEVMNIKEIVSLEPDYSRGRKCMCKLHAFIRKNHARLNQMRIENMRLFVNTPASKLPEEIYIRDGDPELLFYALLYLFYKMVATQMPDEACGYLFLLASSNLKDFSVFDLYDPDYHDGHDEHDDDIIQEIHEYYINLLNLIESPDQNKEKLSDYIEKLHAGGWRGRY